MGLAHEGEALKGGETIAYTGPAGPGAEPEKGESPGPPGKPRRGIKQGSIQGRQIGGEDPFGHESHASP